MPKLDGNMEFNKLPTNTYGYSATKMDKLEAAEYTLVTILVDRSSSVADFKLQLEKCIAEVVYDESAVATDGPPVQFEDVMYELLNIKGNNGVFIQRRMKNFRKFCKKAKWKNFDDVSLAAIHFNDKDDNYGTPNTGI